MSDKLKQQEITIWLNSQDDLSSNLKSAFIDHAIDNRGVLTSTRKADDVASALCSALEKFLDDPTDLIVVSAVAMQFAEQGMSMITGQALMMVLGQTAVSDSGIMGLINQFQLAFLQNLASARELNHHRVQERSQMALQRALHTQLEQQILLHDNEKQRNEHLNQILQLNTRLNQLNNEESLLEEAVYGIYRSLSLTEVSIYGYSETTSQWTKKESTLSNFDDSQKITPSLL